MREVQERNNNKTMVVVRIRREQQRFLDSVQLASIPLFHFQEPTTGAWKLTKDIVRTNGIRGMFVGLSSTIAREMPGYFAFFGSYELTRQVLAKPGQTKEDIGWQRTMLAGSVSGIVLWLVIFPADVVKSRIQVRMRLLRK